MSRQFLMVLFGFLVLMGCAGNIPKLGVNSGQLMPCPNTPNCVSSQTTDKSHFIQPMHFSGAREEAQQRMLQILNTLQQTEIKTVQENYIRAEFTSKIFRFTDDVEFYFMPIKNDMITINLRSASRIGYSDLGANRKRIELIRKLFIQD
ncbi:DUF1499 domain-containing protein [uncultured Paraglaciecola sp.]|jgi:uncharacterized protein (DUF1499 family)|uniref:DUF1499 domain-containing protein n=1 Tax=uncultured Paraglaciecola sp. TaxID=1765024 RepID=UPI0025CECD49|nr:DUF1499 domain-containing protein [uncultured Paraglaciecola sp.]